MKRVTMILAMATFLAGCVIVEGSEKPQAARQAEKGEGSEKAKSPEATKMGSSPEELLQFGGYR